MTTTSHRSPVRWLRLQLQRGQVILATLLLLGLALTLGLYGFMKPTKAHVENTEQTERALAQAKEALIAYAAGRLGNRPGELPCPDRTNNGQATAPCNTTATQIGRLPWFTLGISDLRDGSGERLWYAVSNNFKNAPAITPLNSNTPGQLTVNGLAPANNVIAIVFAPGLAIAGQSRTAANINNVAHHLEGENANGDTNFVMNPAGAIFNDRLLTITSSMFFPIVEMRVAQQLREALNNYYGPNRYFPPANAYGANCTPANQGLIPANPSACGTAYASFGTLLPSWFTANQWHRVLFYAVAPACVDPTALDCSKAGGFLTANGISTVRALLISPGLPYSSQTRPCTNNADCLEPPNTSSFPAFTHSTASATSNDRVVIVAQ